MDIRFNHIISAAVAIVFVVTLANANNVPQNPVVNNQSGPSKPSTKSSSKINFPVSHIEATQKYMTVTSANTTTVKSIYINTTATTSTMETINNIISTTPIMETTNAMTSIGGTVAAEAVTIANIETAIENQTDKNGSLINRHIIKPIRHDGPISDGCPKGYTMEPNGNCKPIFVDKSD